jgi:PAS domain S-box-containing protein
MNSITKLTRYLWIIGVLLFLVLVVLPVIPARQTTLRDLYQQTEQQNLTVSRALTHAYWTDLTELLEGNGQLSAGLEQALVTLQAESKIVKITIFDRAGKVVHSTETASLGGQKVDSLELNKALAGETSRVSKLYLTTHERGEQETLQVVSVYLPIYDHSEQSDQTEHDEAGHVGELSLENEHGEVIGVFEMYSDVSSQLQQVNKAQTGIAAVTTLLLLLIFGTTFFLLKGASKTVADKQKQLERQALLVQQTPTIILELSREGHLLFLNPSAKKHFPDLEGFPELEAATPIMHHPLLTAWDHVTTHLRPGATFEREVRVATKIYLQKIAYNAQSQTYDMYAYDLTQLKRSEAELLKVQREQQAVLAAIPDMMFIADQEGVLLECKVDEKHQAIQQLLGHNFHDLGVIPSTIARQFNDVGKLVLQSQQMQEIEYSLVNATGEEVVYEARVIPLGTERVMSLVRDVSERKLQELALQESEARNRSLLEAIPDMVFVMSREGTYLDIKLDKTHLLIEDLIGRNVRELGFMSPEIAEGIVEKLHRASEGQTQSLEYSLEGNIKGVRRLAHYEARFVPIDKEKVLMLVRDVSQRHDDEMALQQVTREAQRRSRELLLLDKVRSVASQELELKDMISKTVNVIAETFDYTLVSIYLLGQQELVLQHQVGYKEVIERLPLDKGVMGKVARTGQAVLLKSPEDDSDVVWAFEGINSEICVPLLDTGRVVGVLNIESTEQRFFDEADLQLMTALSDTLGVAIERTRLYSETRLKEAEYRELYGHSKEQATELARRNDELALLDQVRSALVSQLELKEFYQAIVEAVTKHLGYPCAFIYEVEEDMFKLAYQVGYTSSLLTMPIQQGISGRVLRTGAAILVPDVSQDPDYVMVQNTILSGIYVPFYSGGMVKGILSVETLREQNLELTEHDLQLLSSLSDMISLGITRVQLYSDLKTSEERYRDLIENASDIIYRIDLTGKFTYANSVVKRLTGYDETEIVGKHYLDLVRSDQREGVQAFYIKQLREKLATTYLEFPALNHVGEEIWIGQNVGLVYAQERIVGMQAVARDITERKRMEEALVKQAEALSSANADLEQFAFIAAHDLQEPLRKIQAFGDRLSLKYKEALDEQGRDYLERMRSSATRMRTLIDDLLSFARANKQQTLEVMSLTPIVKGAVSDLQVLIEETKATINIGGLPTLYVDPSQLRQVFQNLLSNALKFRKPEVLPVITVYSHRLFSGEWEICVSDNGIGFDEQYKERVFGVFQRLHGREHYEGTGIGLAIVRRIIEGHGGTIEVSSRPNFGTTFVLTLPGVAKIHTETAQDTVLA